MALKDLMGKMEREDSNRVEKAPRVAVSAPRTVAPSSSIDATTQISGKIRCKETLRIDGQMKGEVRCEKTLIIGQAAKVEAAIQADTVIIGGEVKGDIIAKRKVTLESTARVTGDLATPGIVIEEGAKLEGRIVIGEEQSASGQSKRADSAATPAREKSATSGSASSRGATSSPN